MSRSRISVDRALRDNLPRGARLLLAVSGGLDSISMLHCAAELSRELNLTLEIAHIDHGLRSESSEDAQFVEELSNSLKLPFHKKVLSPPTGVNFEAWGRKERYSFFRATRESRELDYTCTAHTADDHAETFLMRLVSNKELKTVSRVDERRKVLRPLLDVSRDEIATYACKMELQHREDPTNADTSRLRNRVRHELIPLLTQSFDPRIKEVLSNRAAAICEDSDCLEIMAQQLLTGVEGAYGTKEWLSSLRSALDGAASAVSWRAVELLFKQKLGFNLGRRKAKAALLLFTGAREGIELPGGLSLRRGGGGVIEFRRK